MDKEGSDWNLGPQDMEHLRRLTGLGKEQLQGQFAAMNEAVEKMGFLVCMWANLIEAAAAGDVDVVAAMSDMATAYVGDMRPDELRWIVSLATKAIAQKLRAEHMMADVDPVAAAEEILKGTGGVGG